MFRPESFSVFVCVYVYLCDFFFVCLVHVYAPINPQFDFASESN